jgi:hypothetical protein
MLVARPVAFDFAPLRSGRTKIDLTTSKVPPPLNWLFKGLTFKVTDATKAKLLGVSVDREVRAGG